MKILLVQCPMIIPDAPPLGLAYLASYLKYKGKDVDVMDINLDLFLKQSKENKSFWTPYNSDKWYLIENYDKLTFIKEEVIEYYATRIFESEANIIGFSFTLTSVYFTKKLISKLREYNQGLFIVLGGPAAVPNPKIRDFTLLAGMQELVNAVLIGESELSFLDLCNQLESGGVIKCRGAYLKQDNKWTYGGSRKPLHDLDNFPYPDYNMFQREKYTDTTMIRLMGSRGCYSKCVFCTDTMIGVYQRFRSAKDIFMEMRLRKAQGYNFIEFNDSTLNGNIKILTKLCDLIINSGLKIKWGGSAKIRPDMTNELFQKMHDAGCERLTIGIESGSQKVLDDMNKNIKIEDAIDFLKKAKKVGIQVFSNWIVGFPTETEEDFQMTIEFIQKYHEYFFESAVSTFHVNPHSLIEKNPEKFGIQYDQMKNWWNLNNTLPFDERKRRYNLISDLLKSLNQNINYKSEPKEFYEIHL